MKTWALRLLGQEPPMTQGSVITRSKPRTCLPQFGLAKTETVNRRRRGRFYKVQVSVHNMTNAISNQPSEIKSKTCNRPGLVAGLDDIQMGGNFSNSLPPNVPVATTFRDLQARRSDSRKSTVFGKGRCRQNNAVLIKIAATASSRRHLVTGVPIASSLGWPCHRHYP